MTTRVVIWRLESSFLYARRGETAHPLSTGFPYFFSSGPSRTSPGSTSTILRWSHVGSVCLASAAVTGFDEGRLSDADFTSFYVEIYSKARKTVQLWSKTRQGEIGWYRSASVKGLIIIKFQFTVFFIIMVIHCHQNKYDDSSRHGEKWLWKWLWIHDDSSRHGESRY